MDQLHAYGLTHLQWVPPFHEISPKGIVQKSNLSICFQIATCGLDGMIRFWDLRLGFPFKTSTTVPKKFTHLDEIWEPFHSIEVTSSDNRRKSLTCFTFRNNTAKKEEILELNSPDIPEKENEPDESETDFYAGCDNGMILCGNFKLVRDEDGKYLAKPPSFYQSPHSHSISMITSSPFLRDVFLSAGGKTIAMWKHEIKDQPLLLRERETFITAGQWSPSRAALFILGMDNGSIEVWDVLKDINVPVSIHYLSTAAIKCLSIQSVTEVDSIVAVGDITGVVFTMNLPPHLMNPIDNEVIKMEEFIEQGTSRIINQNISPNVEDKINGKKQKEPAGMKEDLQEVYDKFLELEKQELKLMKILKVDE